MLYTEPAPTTIYRTRGRTRRIRATALVVVIAATAAVLAFVLPASMSTTALTPKDVVSHELRAALGEHPSPPRAGGALGEDDGAIPDGTTVFDDHLPGVANLDPDLLGALREAATDAEDDGVEFVVDSGWRSAAYQEHLLQEAVSKYGSEAEAARWVATPDTSPPRLRGRDRRRLHCRVVALRARRRLWALPDLRERTVALRAAPGSRR